MSKHKALTGAIAALASVATLGALAAPALAADTTYSPNGKPVAELAKHGGAQRIATIGNKNAKNVVLFLGDGMGDSEITVARDYLKGANGHFDGLDAVGQPGVKAGGPLGGVAGPQAAAALTFMNFGVDVQRGKQRIERAGGGVHHKGVVHAFVRYITLLPFDVAVFFMNL